MSSNAVEIRYRLATIWQTRITKRTGRSGVQALSPELPRVTRLMALAIKLDTLLREQPDLSRRELARLGHITTSRLAQILTRLVELGEIPDFEEMLFEK